MTVNIINNDSESVKCNKGREQFAVLNHVKPEAVSSRLLINLALRPKRAAEFLGIGRATLWRWAKERADFPKPRYLSARCTIFDMAELTAWRDAQIGGAK
jgi:prophage regulatory protein